MTLKVEKWYLNMSVAYPTFVIVVLVSIANKLIYDFGRVDINTIAELIFDFRYVFELIAAVLGSLFLLPLIHIGLGALIKKSFSIDWAFKVLFYWLIFSGTLMFFTAIAATAVKEEYGVLYFKPKDYCWHNSNHVYKMTFEAVVDKGVVVPVVYDHLNQRLADYPELDNCSILNEGNWTCNNTIQARSNIVEYMGNADLCIVDKNYLNRWIIRR